MTVTVAVSCVPGSMYRMRCVCCVGRSGISSCPPVPKESHVQESEHVCGCEERRNDPERPQHFVIARIGLPENLVLREEARERRYTGDGDRADQKRVERDRQVLAQAAHVAQVLLAAERVNHGAGSQEQQRLEERVGEKMEDAAGK